MKRLLLGILVLGLLVGSALASVDLGQGKDEYIKGSTVYLSNLQLLAGDFPNATTLYGWNMDSVTNTASESAYAGTKFGTSKDLTIMAQKLTAANDVLGNSKYNAIATGGYLQSTDIVFDVANTADTDDFLVGGWVYIPDVTPAAQVDIFSNTGASNHGWRVTLSTGGLLKGSLDLATDLDTGAVTLSTVGWYHIVFAREVGVVTKLYLNGALAATGADGTMGTTQSKFQLGGSNGANNLPEAGTRYDECSFKKGVLPTNLDDVVKGIYARSAKKFAVKDANTNVFIPELNVSSGVYTPTLTNTTNVAASTAYAMCWLRVGNVVTCSFRAAIDPTAATPTATNLTFTLPIACAATPTGGGAAADIDYAQQGGIYMSAATTATLTYSATDVGNSSWLGIFQYVLN
jgi:hypothetical protein